MRCALRPTRHLSKFDTRAINKSGKGGKQGSMRMGTKKLSSRENIRHAGLKARVCFLNQAQTMQKPPESNHIKPDHERGGAPIFNRLTPRHAPAVIYLGRLPRPIEFYPSPSTPKPLNTTALAPPFQPIPTCARGMPSCPASPEFFFEFQRKPRHYARSLCSGGLRPPHISLK
jgi:hypothetical protein